MSEQRYRVLAERENEQGRKVGWLAAWLRFDPMAGAMMLESMGLLARKWTMAFRPEQMDGFEIALVADIRTLAAIYGGGLLGYGVAWLMSRWAKLPVVELRQSTGEPGQRWVRIQGTGFRRRAATRDLARQIAQFLREHGYRGMIPDVENKELWKFPVVPVLVGCGIVVLVTVCLLIAIFAVVYLSEGY